MTEYSYGEILDDVEDWRHEFNASRRRLSRANTDVLFSMLVSTLSILAEAEKRGRGL